MTQCSACAKCWRESIAEGLGLIDKAILKRDSEGYRTCADWYRLFLCEIYLQMVEGKEKLPLLVLLRNLPTLMKILLTAGSRVLPLIARVLENCQLDPAGHYAGRAQMILGRLYKVKKRNALAIKHLKEAQRIFSQLGRTPVLERSRRRSPSWANSAIGWRAVTMDKLQLLFRLLRWGDCQQIPPGVVDQQAHHPAHIFRSGKGLLTSRFLWRWLPVGSFGRDLDQWRDGEA